MSATSGDGLATAVKLPTPQSRDYRCGQAKRVGRAGKQTDLNDFVKMYPTPSAQEPGWRNIEVVDKNGNAPAHPNQRFYDKISGRVVQKGLSQVVRMFPTPRANKIGGKSSSGWSPTLEQFVGEKFPTPTNSMMTLGDMEQARYSGSGGKRPDYKKANAFPTPTAMDHIVRKGKRPSREQTGRKTGYLSEEVIGQLNPDWVEWLMHWPIGWTDLEPLKELIWLDPSQDPHPEVPRVTAKKKNRTNRLKAIGNGQYPDCAAQAFKILGAGN